MLEVEVASEAVVALEEDSGAGVDLVVDLAEVSKVGLCHYCALLLLALLLTRDGYVLGQDGGFGGGFGNHPQGGFNPRGGFGGGFGGRGGFGGPSGPGGVGGGGYLGGSAVVPSKQIFVKNVSRSPIYSSPKKRLTYSWAAYHSQLPWSTSNEDLIELFQTTGKVEEAEVLFEAGRSKGAGIVQFETVDEAQTAITKFQNYAYGNRPLTLDFNGRFKNFDSARAAPSYSDAPMAEQ